MKRKNAGKRNKSEFEKVMDLLLRKSDHRDIRDTIALFMFYLNKSLKEGKPLITATDEYCKKCLGIGSEVLRRVKGRLKELRLITIVQIRRENKDFGEFHVKINNPERYIYLGVPLINKRVEDKTQNIEASLHDGNAAEHLKPEHLNRCDKILGSSPALGATGDSKQELLPCPKKHAFGKDEPNCDDYCEIAKQCRKYYRENYKPLPKK